MTKTYHTWRQDAKALREAGWELSAVDKGNEIPCAEWAKCYQDGTISSEFDTGTDIMAAIRGATRKAMKRLEQLNAEAKAAQEKTNE